MTLRYGYVSSSHSLERSQSLVSLETYRRRLMELFSFDAEYVRRLRAGDAAVEEHFVDYFGRLLTIKLRARGVPPATACDLTQETFLRVLRALRAPAGISNPEALGAFVNATCNNVLFEQYRSGSRYQALDETHADQPSNDPDILDVLVKNENRAAVLEVLDALPTKDGAILRAIFVDEQPKDEICAEFGIKRDYLRVVLHRAKEQFRRRFLERRGEGRPNAESEAR